MPETTRVEVADVAAALARIAEGVFLSLLGKPTSRTSRELRYGRRGSLACRIAGPHAGRWTSFEDGTHGDLLDMIQRERRVDLPEAPQIALNDYLSGRPLPVAPARPDPPAASRIIDPDDEAQGQLLAQAWRDAASARRYSGERYFVETRRIDVRGTLPCARRPLASGYLRRRVAHAASDHWRAVRRASNIHRRQRSQDRPADDWSTGRR